MNYYYYYYCAPRPRTTLRTYHSSSSRERTIPAQKTLGRCTSRSVCACSFLLFPFFKYIYITQNQKKQRQQRQEQQQQQQQKQRVCVRYCASIYIFILPIFRKNHPSESGDARSLSLSTLSSPQKTPPPSEDCNIYPPPPTPNPLETQHAYQ